MWPFTANRRYRGIPFDPVHVEHTHTDLKVEGEIPSELTGLYLRNGPNPAGPIGWRHHYFSGDGMVHGVKVERGRARWYRNRFVRAGGVPKALGEPDPGGPVSSGLDVSPNTNVIRFGDRMFASNEGGPSLVELGPHLETISRSTLDGVVPDGFTGHHKVDPDDGDIHGVVYSGALGTNALYLRMTEDGRMLNRVKVPLAGNTQIHDMSISRRYAVIYDLNVEFRMWMLPLTTLPIRWSPRRPSRLGILPKGGDASDVRWFEVEPCYVYHPMNAFETDDDKLVLDVSRYAQAAKKDLYGPLGDTTPTIHRWTLDLASGGSAVATEEVLFNLALDFPKVSPRFEGRNYRFGYGVEASLRPSFDAAIKMDLETRTTQRQAFDGGMASELTFIPRSESGTEDDGWLMGFVFQPERQRSRLVILDAQRFTDPPVASIWIPEQYVPIGTHGGWFPDPGSA
ncbi:MAG: carotenoid oxygenase family protein [Myxococcota bacterium]